jgi:hypothetical protein
MAPSPRRLWVCRGEVYVAFSSMCRRPTSRPRAAARNGKLPRFYACLVRGCGDQSLRFHWLAVLGWGILAMRDPGEISGGSEQP